MSFTNTTESGLESLIVKWLIPQNHYEARMRDEIIRCEANGS